MLERLSTLQKTALVVGIPATGALLYLLLKKLNEEDNIDFRKQKVVTSRQTIIEVKIPRESVGAVIGQQGSVIKGIQELTGARVNFKDDPPADGDDRTVIIRGNQTSAQQAELEIKKVIAAQPTIITDTVIVPGRSIGRIIGRNGDTIREMCRISRCKISVPRGERSDPNGNQEITLKGTPLAVDNAKSLIKEKVDEHEAFRARTAVAAANRPHRDRKHKNRSEMSPPPAGEETVTSEATQQSQSSPPVTKVLNGSGDGPLVNDGIIVQNGLGLTTGMESWPSSKDYLEVYVSAVENAEHFWVQVLGPKSTHLDKLIVDMTEHYDDTCKKTKAPEGVSVGDVVAAPFQHDSNWYRAKVIETKDEQLFLYFVDFGDSDWSHQSAVRSLRSDFLRLPYQATEVYLANVKPANGDTWSDEASDLFETLSHAAKWVILMAKTVTYIQTDEGSVPCIELIDTNGEKDVNVAEELVKHGFAEWSREDSTPSPSPNCLTPERPNRSPGKASPSSSPKITKVGAQLRKQATRVQNTHHQRPSHVALPVPPEGVPDLLSDLTETSSGKRLNNSGTSDVLNNELSSDYILSKSTSSICHSSHSTIVYNTCDPFNSAPVIVEKLDSRKNIVWNTTSGITVRCSEYDITCYPDDEEEYSNNNTCDEFEENSYTIDNSSFTNSDTDLDLNEPQIEEICDSVEEEHDCEDSITDTKNANNEDETGDDALIDGATKRDTTVLTEVDGVDVTDTNDIDLVSANKDRIVEDPDVDLDDIKQKAVKIVDAVILKAIEYMRSANEETIVDSSYLETDTVCVQSSTTLPLTSDIIVPKTKIDQIKTDEGSKNNTNEDNTVTSTTESEKVDTEIAVPHETSKETSCRSDELCCIEDDVDTPDDDVFKENKDVVESGDVVEVEVELVLPGQKKMLCSEDLVNENVSYGETGVTQLIDTSKTNNNIDVDNNNISVQNDTQSNTAGEDLNAKAPDDEERIFLPKRRTSKTETTADKENKHSADEEESKVKKWFRSPLSSVDRLLELLSSKPKKETEVNKLSSAGESEATPGVSDENEGEESVSLQLESDAQRENLEDQKKKKIDVHRDESSEIETTVPIPADDSLLVSGKESEPPEYNLDIKETLVSELPNNSEFAPVEELTTKPDIPPNLKDSSVNQVPKEGISIEDRSDLHTTEDVKSEISDNDIAESVLPNSADDEQKLTAAESDHDSNSKTPEQDSSPVTIEPRNTDQSVGKHEYPAPEGTKEPSEVIDNSTEQTEMFEKLKDLIQLESTDLSTAPDSEEKLLQSLSTLHDSIKRFTASLKKKKKAKNTAENVKQSKDVEIDKERKDKESSLNEENGDLTKDNITQIEHESITDVKTLEIKNDVEVDLTKESGSEEDIESTPTGVSVPREEQITERPTQLKDRKHKVDNKSLTPPADDECNSDDRIETPDEKEHLCDKEKHLSPSSPMVDIPQIVNEPVFFDSNYDTIIEDELSSDSRDKVIDRSTAIVVDGEKDSDHTEGKDGSKILMPSVDGDAGFAGAVKNSEVDDIVKDSESNQTPSSGFFLFEDDTNMATQEGRLERNIWSGFSKSSVSPASREQQDQTPETFHWPPVENGNVPDNSDHLSALGHQPKESPGKNFASGEIERRNEKRTSSMPTRMDNSKGVIPALEHTEGQIRHEKREKSSLHNLSSDSLEDLTMTDTVDGSSNCPETSSVCSEISLDSLCGEECETSSQKGEDVADNGAMVKDQDCSFEGGGEVHFIAQRDQLKRTGPSPARGNTRNDESVPALIDLNETMSSYTDDSIELNEQDEGAMCSQLSRTVFELDRTPTSPPQQNRTPFSGGQLMCDTNNRIPRPEQSAYQLPILDTRSTTRRAPQSQHLGVGVIPGKGKAEQTGTSRDQAQHGVARETSPSEGFYLFGDRTTAARRLPPDTLFFRSNVKELEDDTDSLSSDSLADDDDEDEEVKILTEFGEQAVKSLPVDHHLECIEEEEGGAVSAKRSRSSDIKGQRLLMARLFEPATAAPFGYEEDSTQL